MRHRVSNGMLSMTPGDSQTSVVGNNTIIRATTLFYSHSYINIVLVPLYAM